jgi:4-hydroxy-3-methylbut-2-enyl diphosphate reductase
MKITLSKHAGFCGGVARAFEMVEKIAKDPKTKKPIFVLGSLVHNSDVVKKIEAWGAKKINLETLRKIDSAEIGTLVVTAHGVGPMIYALLKKKNITVVDTTCPRVIKVQRLAKLFSDRKTQIVIVGEKEHKEIKGIFGWARSKAKIVETEKALKRLKLDSQKPIAVISQTTQSQDFLKRTAGYIRAKYPQAEIVDTICLATQHRQGEVKELAKKNDAVVIIGSPESANSTRLFEVAQILNPKSYFVERASQLKKSWFKGVKKVGVTAGASTPDWIIKEVIKKLKSYES